MLKEVDISIIVICYASAIIEYGRRTPELSNTPLHITHDKMQQYIEYEDFKVLRFNGMGQNMGQHIFKVLRLDLPRHH